MECGIYDLDLYCDRQNRQHGFEEFPHVYTDEYGARARKAARKDGWVWHRDGTLSCPMCSGKKTESAKPSEHSGD